MSEAEGTEYISISACDSMSGLENHGEWKVASRSIKNALNKECKEPEHLDFYHGALYQFTCNETGRFKSTQLAVLLTVPDQERLEAFRDIDIYAAPPGTKTIDFTLDEETLIEQGFYKTKVGAAQERCHNFWKQGVKAKRRQYALRHYIATTIHSAIGHTVSKLATQLTAEHNLWEKAMVIVLISRVRRAVDLIFVGDKESNLNALTEGLKKRNQYDEYMNHVVQVLSSKGSFVEPLVLGLHPFRYKDIPMPQDRSGVVYMLVSQLDSGSLYIGNTKNVIRRMNEHNSGIGARESAPREKRPWGLYAYVTGFGGDKQLMRQVEHQWQHVVESLGPVDPREATAAFGRFLSTRYETNRFVLVVADTE